MKKTESKKTEKRPTVVSVLGHVDHGKTTLLDYIRKTKVQSREAGGITQGIGASVVKTKNGDITFIDTPGHSAFEEMRSRGASLADIVVLVVAANDGVKPQTVEAIKHIKNSGTPFLVAITKVDLSSAKPDEAKKQLGYEDVKVEGAGGDVPVVFVSGVTGQGVDELLETILLMVDVNGLKGTKNDDLEAIVIETGKDKRGKTVSVVLKKGELKVGDEVFEDGGKIKVRGLFDSNEKAVKSVSAGMPALILGFNNLPKVGSVISSTVKTASGAKQEKTANLSKDETPVLIKAKNAGSLEAVIANLPKGIVAISSSVGELTENDVFLAKSSNAKVLLFETTASKQVKNLASTEGVEIFEFEIIYELFKKCEEILNDGKEKILGEAKIVASFPFNSKKVAGCKIMTGEFKKGKVISLFRQGEEVGKTRIVSMRKQKDEISVAKEGEECGIILAPQLAFEIGDMLVSVAQDK